MQQNADKRYITYPDVLKYFCFDKRSKKLKRRKKHVLAFTPHNAELYFMHMLLYPVPGPTCYEDRRSVNGIVHDMYMAACIAKGICENDCEVDIVMEEAASVAFGGQLREIFANMLMYVLKKDYIQFWERHKLLISEDLTHAAGLSEPDENIINQVLFELQDHVE